MHHPLIRLWVQTPLTQTLQLKRKEILHDFHPTSRPQRTTAFKRSAWETLVCIKRWWSKRVKKRKNEIRPVWLKMTLFRHNGRLYWLVKQQHEANVWEQIHLNRSWRLNRIPACTSAELATAHHLHAKHFCIQIYNTGSCALQGLNVTRTKATQAKTKEANEVNAAV